VCECVCVCVSVGVGVGVMYTNTTMGVIQNYTKPYKCRILSIL